MCRRITWLASSYSWLLITSLMLGLSGCGYTLSHRLRGEFQSKRGLFVPVFHNYTEETGAERIFTSALVKELESHGNIVMDHKGEDGLELRGAVTGISYAPSVLSDFGYKGLQVYRRLPVELGLNVSVALTLVDTRTGKVLWSGSFAGFRRVETPTNRTYDFEAPSSLGLFTLSLVETRYQDVARDIMRDVYDAMVEFF